MSTKKKPPFSAPQSAPESGVFPGADAISADSERFTRIAEALLGPLPIEEGILVLAESDGMTPARALWQLTRWARGTMAPFLAVGPDGQLRLDLSTPEAYAHRDLLRQVVQTHGTQHTEHGTTDVVEVSVELFNAVQAAQKVVEWHQRYSPSVAPHPQLPESSRFTTYLDLINQFWQKDLAHPFTSTEVNEYFRLLDQCNQLGSDVADEEAYQRLVQEVRQRSTRE